jgi:hypothetical protein
MGGESLGGHDESATRFSKNLHSDAVLSISDYSASSILVNCLMTIHGIGISKLCQDRGQFRRVLLPNYLVDMALTVA